MISALIWKDTYYTTTAGTFDYYIRVKGTQVPIYHGRAYKCPGDASIAIKINDICANYLGNSLPDGWVDEVYDEIYKSYDAPDVIKEFELYVINTDEEVEVKETYRFYYDWSYYSSSYSSRCMTRTINGHYTDAEFLFCTLSVVSTSAATVANEISYAEPDELTHPELYTEHVCGQAALYYLTPEGAWSSFVIEGSVKQTDNHTKKNIIHNYNNTLEMHGKDTYLDQIVETYELHTGYLTDEQSEILANDLLRSVKCYLHIIGHDLMPVVITNSAVEHKKFANGRKLNAYTINVENSQIKNIR